MATEYHAGRAERAGLTPSGTALVTHP
jgi:hypothetical protein